MGKSVDQSTLQVPNRYGHHSDDFLQIMLTVFIMIMIEMMVMMMVMTVMIIFLRRWRGCSPWLEWWG